MAESLTDEIVTFHDLPGGECATIRLPRLREAADSAAATQWVKATHSALEACSGRGKRFSAVYLWAASVADEDVELKDRQDGAVRSVQQQSSSSSSSSAQSFDGLVARIEQLSVLTVGLVESEVCGMETCLFAACDMVISTLDAEFTLTTGDACGVAAIPVSLVRQLGASVAAAAAAGSGMISAASAQEVGLVAEVVPDAAALHRRQQEMMTNQSSLSVVATKLWAKSRRATARASAGADGARRLPEQIGLWSAISRRGTKRPAPWCPEGTAKRRAHAESLGDSGCSGDVRQKCQDIVAALAESQELPAALGSLLHEVVIHTLGMPQGQRNAFETGAIELIGKGLAEVEGVIRQVVDESQAMLDAAGTEGAILDGHLAAAESDLASVRSRIQEIQSQLVKQTAALKEAAAAITEAEAEEAKANEESDATAAKKAKLEAAFEQIYEPLRDGALTGAKLKKQAAALIALGQQYDFDDTLLNGLPGALAASPAKRTPMDSMFLKAFEAELQGRIADLDKAIEEGVPEREDRAQATQEVRDAHTRAKEAQSESLTALVAARESVKAREAARRTAEQAAKAFPPERRRVEAEHELVKVQLAAFLKGPLRAFRELSEAATAGATEPAVEAAAVVEAQAGLEIDHTREVEQNGEATL